MDLRAYLAILIRRKWIVICTVVVTAAIAGIASKLMPPMYAATTTVRVATGVSGRVEYADYIYAERLMNTYAEILSSAPVLDEVKQRLGLNDLPDIKTEVVRDTELIRITAEGSDPLVSQNVANALADVLKSQSEELYTGSTKSAREILGELIARAESELAQLRLDRDAAMTGAGAEAERIDALNSSIQLKEQTLALLLAQFENAQFSEAIRANAITIVEPASRPWTPSKPNTKVNVVLGTAIGLLAGLGLAFMFENMDSTLHTTEAIESTTELPILGRIPVAGPIHNGRRVQVSAPGFSLQDEAYRRLRTNILALSTENHLKTMAASSADRGEGKSTVIANLAMAFARTGRRVLLIDADLRLPVLHTLFELPNRIGLSNVLCREVGLDEAVQNGRAAGLYVLTSGPPPQDPAELLGTEHMRELLRHSAEQYDLVLIDTPCLLSVADAAIMSPLVDGVLLVVSRSLATREDVRASIGQLSDVRANTVGVVINRAEKSPKYYYGGHLQRVEEAEHEADA